MAFQKLLIYDDIKKAEKEGGKILKVKTDGIYTDKEIKVFEYRIIKGVKTKIGENPNLVKTREGKIVRDNYQDLKDYIYKL